jgi:hypothetical protein
MTGGRYVEAFVVPSSSAVGRRGCLQDCIEIIKPPVGVPRRGRQNFDVQRGIDSYKRSAAGPQTTNTSG